MTRTPLTTGSEATYHRARRDLILMPVTSRLRLSAFGDMLIQDWQTAGLLMPSAIKPVFATLHHDLVIKSLGSLSSRDQTALKTLMPQLVG